MPKIYGVKITRQAEEQLRHIARYIAIELRAKEAAMRMLGVLEEKICSLKWMPERIPLVQERL